MTSAAVFVFFFMLGSSLIGYFIAKAINNPSLVKLVSNLNAYKKDFFDLKAEHKSILTYTNQLHKEKEKLIYANDKLAARLHSLAGTVLKLQRHKVDLFEDYENELINTEGFDQKIGDLNAAIERLNLEMEKVKNESQLWKIRYEKVLKEKEVLSHRLKSLKMGA